MYRNQMSPKERALRSKLAQLVHQEPFLHATVNVRHITCGKKNCRCAKGQKHRALYLVCNTKGKTRQLFVPPSMEQEICRRVENYHSTVELIDKISEHAWGELKRRKEKGDI